jgi:tetratricopeptide (TPR) repeat protein
LLLHYKAILLLILSLILVNLLSNNSSTPFFEFEGKGIINHYAALALGSTPHDPSQNNTEGQSTTYPIYQRNKSSSVVSTLVDKAYAIYSQGNYTQAIEYYDRMLDIDPGDKNTLDSKGNVFSNQAITHKLFNTMIRL